MEICLKESLRTENSKAKESSSVQIRTSHMKDILKMTLLKEKEFSSTEEPEKLTEDTFARFHLHLFQQTLERLHCRENDREKDRRSTKME
jgi:hypothetical protein